MLSRTMRVVKQMSYLLKPNASFVDLQLNLLEVREPFNTKYGFMCRFFQSEDSFRNKQDAFTFLNNLYRVVYGEYLFNSLKDLRNYMDTIPEEKNGEYYNIKNDEILSLLHIDKLI